MKLFTICQYCFCHEDGKLTLKNTLVAYCFDIVISYQLPAAVSDGKEIEAGFSAASSAILFLQKNHILASCC